MRNLRNRIDYYLRGKFRWHRSGFRPPITPQKPLFQHLDADFRVNAVQMEKKLASDYHLDKLKEITNSGNYQENLFYLHMLQTAFSDLPGYTLPDKLHAADIGPSHWFYVHSLVNFLKWHQTDTSRNVTLDGYEADPWRVYSDLYSRYDRALGYIGDLENTFYHPKSFSTQTGEYDLIFMFFPFVFIKDHRGWGLPDEEFQPEKLRKDVWSSINQGGRLIVVNQGLDEHQHEKYLLSGANIPIEKSFQMDDLLFRYNLDRYIIVSKSHE
jgi:hypothetical protein